MYKSIYLSPIGKMIMTCDESFDSLTGLYFDGQKHLPCQLQHIEIKDNLKIFQDVKDKLNQYFSGKNPDFNSIRLYPTGTPFQLKVWQILLNIGYDKTMTYGEIADIVAKDLGKEKMFPQAIGGAVGHNPISIIIPCHRVLGRNHSLTGYAGGIERKQFLLDLENKIKVKSKLWNIRLAFFSVFLYN